MSETSSQPNEGASRRTFLKTTTALVGGAMLGANSKSNFTIPPGAQATVQLSQTVTVRRQASAHY